MEFHKPVLKQEVIEGLLVEPGEFYFDATIGGGGHAVEILNRGGIVLGIDRDPKAVAQAKERLATCPASFAEQKEAIKNNRSFSKAWRVVCGNFADLDKIAAQCNLTKVAGILFDLGTSHHQLTEKERGFSFESPNLDMRMNPELKVTAADLVAALSEDELSKLFKKFAQEKRARTIARAIVRARKVKPITSGKRLAKVVAKTVGGRKKKIHPATKVFQALRIAVNDELNNLRRALPQAVELLKKEGRLVIISFHEGEDRIVKHYFKQINNKKIKTITKKPITAGEKEVTDNPSARSAKLRIAKKI